MAAGTSEEMVPQLFEDLIDSDSSSSSDYCSIASDSYGVVEEVSFPLYKSSVMSVLHYLDYRDEVSLMFLLTEDINATFHKLLHADSRPREVLADWLISQRDGDWENKLIESLCITQNYQVLGFLVKNVPYEKSRFAVQSVFVNRTRKALYLMCEALCAEELDELVQRMIKCTNLYRKFPCELMELYLMFWSCRQCISLGDGNGRGVDMQILKSVLISMNKVHLAVSIESSAVHRDGPDISTSTCSSMRLSTNPTVSVHTSVQSTRSSNFYDVDPNNVGICLIINQKVFHQERSPRYQYHLVVHGDKQLETREGTDVDRDRLWEIFRSMGFTVIVEENLKHLQILSTVQEVISKMRSEHSCFVLCILSHGAEGIVSGCNSVAVYREQLENCLTEAPNLIGKPKLMILQVCQGEKLQSVVYCDDMVAVDGPTVRSIGASADILTFWSTMPGYASLRDKKRGTWFVEALWRQFMSARSNEDINTLFTRVTNDVTSRRLFLEGGYKTMVPEQCNRLTKRLVLPHIPKYKLEVAEVMFERFLFESLKKQYEKSRNLDP